MKRTMFSICVCALAMLLGAIAFAAEDGTLRRLPNGDCVYQDSTGTYYLQDTGQTDTQFQQVRRKYRCWRIGGPEIDIMDVEEQENPPIDGSGGPVFYCIICWDLAEMNPLRWLKYDQDPGAPPYFPIPGGIADSGGFAAFV